MVLVDNGADAIEARDGVDCDLIVMDVQMPRVSGLQAVEELRRRGDRIPILALTAHAMVEEREKCLAAGFDEFLTKPVTREELARTVDAMLVEHGRKEREVMT